MKGLLLKDAYTLVKQMKLMLLILVAFACVPGNSMSAYAVFYSAMLPITSIAYDERSKWDELAVMMPYSARTLVFSKYILGIVAVTISTVVAFIAQFVSSSVQGLSFDTAELFGLLLIACLSLILLSVNLPFIFRLGVEKGRIAFIILICGGVVSGMMLREKMLLSINNMMNAPFIIAGSLILTFIVIASSMMVSVPLYNRRKG